MAANPGMTPESQGLYSPPQPQLPASLKSAEALEYIGYTAPIAAYIFSSYCDHPHDPRDPNTLLNFALRGSTHATAIAPWPTQDSSDIANAMGVIPQLLEGFQKDLYCEIVLAEAVAKWIYKTLKLNHSKLQQRMILRQAKAVTIGRFPDRALRLGVPSTSGQDTEMKDNVDGTRDQGLPLHQLIGQLSILSLPPPQPQGLMALDWYDDEYDDEYGITSQDFASF